MIDLTKLSDLEILTLTLIGEARGEVVEGIIAVGNVIRNRSRKLNKTIDEICLTPKQFSCWDLEDPNRAVLEEIAQIMLIGQPLKDPIYNQCAYIANGIMFGSLLDNTHGSLNYLTLKLWDNNRPSWAKNVNFAVSKGNQIFFTAV